MIKNILKIFTGAIIIMLLAYGFYLRFKVYLLHAGSWCDEFFLINNVIFKSYIELFYNMDILICPPLFACLIKLVTNIFGVNFYSLRIIALLFSCASLTLFYPLLEKIFKNKICILFGLLLFSINGMLIYYSAECKQYSCEVFFCVLLLFLFDKFNTNSKKNTIFWIIMSFVSPFFAFSSVFIIIAFLLYKLLEKSISIKNKIPYLYIALSLLLSIVILYITTYSNQAEKFAWFDSRYYHFSLNHLWFALTEFFKYLNLYSVFILFIFFCGIITSFIRKNQYGIISSIIILNALISSFIFKYPFHGRLIIYLTPLIIILLISVLDINYKKFKLANVIPPPL